MRRLLASEATHLILLLLLVALYLATVIPHLEDDPIAGGDEGWIISASAKLSLIFPLVCIIYFHTNFLLSQ